jgi:hypothetical protein
MPDQPRYAPFVPLGVPQFKADHRKKGWWFALAEGATGAASLGAWLYLSQRYGFPGTVPAEEEDRARALQRIEIGTGVAFLALYAWGVIDALATAPPPCARAP